MTALLIYETKQLPHVLRLNLQYPLCSPFVLQRNFNTMTPLCFSFAKQHCTESMFLLPAISLLIRFSCDLITFNNFFYD